MADSSNQDLVNTAERHDTSMEGDNNSDTTEVMGANATFQAPKMIEKCIKFVFRVTTNEEASTVAQGHFHDILKAINNAFGSEVLIMDNANEQVTKFKLTGFQNTSGNLKFSIGKEMTRRNNKSASPLAHSDPPHLH
jgi:NAD/NADP transhydrogenase alpha subunit